MFSFIGWLIIGLVAGAMARFLVPGRQPMTLFWTMLLGLGGSVLGGLLYSLLFGTNPGDPSWQTGGFLLSIVGAVVILAVYVANTNNNSPVPRS